MTSRNGDGAEGQQEGGVLGGAGGVGVGVSGGGGLGIVGLLGDNNPYASVEDMGMVQDGTKCGDEMVNEPLKISSRSPNLLIFPLNRFA